MREILTRLLTSQGKDNMTAPSQENQQQVAPPSDKELNFRKLEAKYQQELQQERAARQEAEKKVQQQAPQDDNDTTEPYVDHRKLNKTLAKLGQSTQSDIQKAMETAKQAAKEELKQEIWLDSNPDFYEVLKHADKLAAKSPKLAVSILRMPDTFERQRLVYENIKEFGLHKPAPKESSVQEKIDANRKSPYYQPTSVGSAPYAGSQSDFSPNGQKDAYAKMQELKNRLRI